MAFSFHPGCPTMAWLSSMPLGYSRLFLGGDFFPYGEVDGRTVHSTGEQDRALIGIGIDAIGKCSEDLLCPICHLPAFGGVMIEKCGHYFHEDCVDQALQNNRICPVCREPVSAQDPYTLLSKVNSARFLVKSINELNVLCPMGCGAHVPWESLKSHVVNSCSKTLFFCKHRDCSVSDHRGSIETHEVGCQFAEVLCECGQEMRRIDAAKHKQESCPAQPVECSYCTAPNILRSDMDRHLDECNGAVPMRFVRELIRRVDALEKEQKESSEGRQAKRRCQA